jgi:hypothetical protein
MRKILGLASLALMLLAGVACNNEDVPNEPQGKYPILFGNYETRATAGLDDLKANGFKVYAYFEGNTGNSHTFVKEVTYSDAQNVWGYEGLEYWIPGATYWFKAFYPTTPSAGTLTVYNTSSTQPFTIADFDISQQEDIMVATAERSVADGAKFPTTGSSVVDLDFQHLLACVAIELKSEITDVTVSDISLEDIAQTGNYSNGIWTSEQTVTINKQYSGEALVKDATDFVDVTDGGFLVIPEAIGGRQKMIIRTSHKKYDVVIPTITWEPGKKYTYTLTIKQENIEFNEPGVDIWDEENATGSVVIK